MKQDSFKDFVLDQLSGEATARPMFGGWGLYMGESFFGIVHKGRLYFRTDGSTRARYEEAGMAPFRPGAKQVLKNYYEVPPDVLEDAAKISEWARAAARADR